MSRIRTANGLASSGHPACSGTVLVGCLHPASETRPGLRTVKATDTTNARTVEFLHRGEGRCPLVPAAAENLRPVSGNRPTQALGAGRSVRYFHVVQTRARSADNRPAGAVDRPTEAARSVGCPRPVSGRGTCGWPRLSSFRPPSQPGRRTADHQPGTHHRGDAPPRPHTTWGRLTVAEVPHTLSLRRWCPPRRKASELPGSG